LGCVAFTPGVQAAASVPVLTAQSRILEVNGKAAKVFGIVNSLGGIGHSLLASDRFQAEVVNDLGEDTLIHWHGLLPPSEQDGVPDLSQPALKPGERARYDFASRIAGTHWMHSHAGLQEQQLLAAPLIIRETEQPIFADREHVVMLHDFSFRPPGEILAELQGGGGAHAGHAMPGMGEGQAMDHSTMQMSGGTGMLNDVVFDAYLANDRTLADPETVSVATGETIRLRIINACAASNMWIDLGQLEGELIAVDGHAIKFLKGSRFPLAIAQRADVLVKIPEHGRYPILFRPEGVTKRTGIILATQGAVIEKLGEDGEAAPALDLVLEAQLKPVGAFPEEPVTRTEVLMLTGGEQGYQWGFNGKPMMHETLFTVREGERIDVIMHNMTSMAHPMHLHGHYFKIVGINGQAIDGALRDTVLVPPGAAVTIRFDANNPGNWAFHCHHLYHMNSGMMGAIRYSSAA
jgi:FtsP/CotA-like multicopper oxidase with cupredoxin domain